MDCFPRYFTWLCPLLVCVATGARVIRGAEVVPLPTAQTALVGRFAGGPVDLPLEVDEAGFVARFGSADPAAWPAEVQARQFFANGGGRLFVCRLRPGDPLRGALLGSPGALTGVHALAPLSDLRLLIAPEVSLLPPGEFTEVFAALRAIAEARRVFFILDPPPGLAGAAEAIAWKDAAVPDPADFCALYFPYLQVMMGAAPLTVPASGAMAAVYAANDATDGVWNRPAGTGFPLEAEGLTPAIGADAADALNVEGINVMRDFVGVGIVPFGARTLAPFANARRYIAVVRMEDWVEACLVRTLAFAATRENAEPLWAEIRAAADEFLLSLWQQGALQGNRPEDAYFVRCDATTTNAADIAAHRVNLLYGLALLRPSEFELTPLSAPTRDPLRPPPVPSLHIRPLGDAVHLFYPTAPGFDYTLDISPGGNFTWFPKSTSAGDGAWGNLVLPREHDRVRAARPF